MEESPMKHKKPTRNMEMKKKRRRRT